MEQSIPRTIEQFIVKRAGVTVATMNAQSDGYVALNSGGKLLCLVDLSQDDDESYADYLKRYDRQLVDMAAFHLLKHGENKSLLEVIDIDSVNVPGYAHA